MDRDLKLLGLAAMSSALDIGGERIANVAVAGAERKYGDHLPFGRVVSDPVYRSLLADDGVDPDTVWFPPTGVRPGDYNLNDLVQISRDGGRKALSSWLPEGKGTDRGEVEVELVNGFVEDFFPLVSDEGGSWEYMLGVAEKVLHDLLNEEYEEEWPVDLSEQLVFVENLLESEAEGGS